MLYIIGDLAHGGAEKHLVHVLKNLNRTKFEPSVACFRKIGQYLPQVEALNIPVINLGVRKVYNFQGISKILSFSKFVKEQKIDIIHAYLYKANIFGTLVAKNVGIPVIISNRNVNSLMRFREKLIHKKISALADKITAVSDEVKSQDLELGIPADKIITIYNGVEIPNRQLVDIPNKKRELGLNSDDVVIGTVANLAPRKGHKYLLEAAAKIIAVKPSVKFLLIGDGGLKQELLETARNLKLGKNVIFAGHREDVAELLAVMDIFVLPSLGEGMSNALLEAMAAGLPCVATNVGGNPEVVQDGVTGFIVPPKEPDKIAEAVCRLLADKQMALALGMKGKKRVMSKFTVREMVLQMERLYWDCLSHGPDPEVHNGGFLSSSRNVPVPLGDKET
ncbi:MAG: glycosyltransferase [Candidatus Schekmanbacteria bacterium]|nr:glycosyltransferase [Candidatus Schekmanbacteria bacterium]